MSAPWWDDDYNGRTIEHRIHVGNLSWHTDEQSLMDAFADYDPIIADVSGFRSMTARYYFLCFWHVYLLWIWMVLRMLPSRFRSSLAASFFVYMRSVLSRAPSLVTNTD